jgi:hypothetical protein
MKWLKEQGCPWSSSTFAFAVEHGNINIMVWLKEQLCPWSGNTFASAASHGNLDNLKWLKAQGCPCYLLTATSGYYRPEIREWLKQEGLFKLL